MEHVKHLIANKKILVIGTAAALVVVLGVVGFFVLSAYAQDEIPTTSVQSATAESGSVSVTVAGTGTIADGTTTDIVVPTGVTVDEVLVESGDTVETGQQLATLNKASIASALIEVNESLDSVAEEIDSLTSDASDTSTTEYLESIVLAGEYEDLQEAQTTLTTLLNNPVITATTSGTIGSINVSEGSEVTKTTSTNAGATTSDSIVATGTTSAASGTSDAVTTTADASTTAAATPTAYTSQATYTLESAVTSQASDEDSARDASSDSLLITVYNESASTYTNQISTTDATITLDNSGAMTGLDLSVTAPESGKTPQASVSDCEVYTASLTWNCATDTFAADTVYTATITLTAKDNYTFYSDIVPTVAGATVASSVLSDENKVANKVLVIKAKFAKTASDATNASTSGAPQSTSGSGSGSSDTLSTTINSGSGVSAGSSGTTSNSAGSSALGTSTSSDAASASSASSDYGLYMTTAFTIVSTTDATVSINVDEADILSIKEGQTAVITLDALEGQEFEGTITSVSTTSSSSSGSAKYTAVITVDRTEDMLDGMSASATITVDEASDALLIPVAALQERGNTTFVYTELDSEDNPTGEVEVETGLSNGSQVEIVSGLSAGDTVYYTRTESSTSSESAQGFSMGDMGEMPSGGQMGEMPSGEMPSGDMPSGGFGGSSGAPTQQ